MLTSFRPCEFIGNLSNTLLFSSKKIVDDDIATCFELSASFDTLYKKYILVVVSYQKYFKKTRIVHKNTNSGIVLWESCKKSRDATSVPFKSSYNHWCSTNVYRI